LTGSAHTRAYPEQAIRGGVIREQAIGEWVIRGWAAHNSGAGRAAARWRVDSVRARIAPAASPRTPGYNPQPMQALLCGKPSLQQEGFDVLECSPKRENGDARGMIAES